MPAPVLRASPQTCSEVASPDADNLDLVNKPATFDHEGDETSWQQGLPPGEVGPQLSELELSDSVCCFVLSYRYWGIVMYGSGALVTAV